MANNLLIKENIKPSFNTEKSIYLTNNKKTKKNSEKEKKTPLFCTECDRELNIFWLTDMASDKNAVKNNHEDCKKTGKFKGQYCSRMFISGVYTDKVLKRKKK